jgi:hypothetical protein
MNLLPILSEYQHGTRNARIYKMANGQYGVNTFEADTDYNGFEAFSNEDDAECFAENWVLSHEPI